MILPRVSDPVPININITIDDFVIKNLATFEVIAKNEKSWTIQRFDNNCAFFQTQLAHLDLEGLGLELNLTLADLRVIFSYKC